jgi:hypothetical protein
MRRTPKSRTADERAAIKKAVDELIAIGMDRERAWRKPAPKCGSCGRMYSS